MKIIALIPARGGSKRVPGKNVRELNGHPLLFYTIAAAQESGIFSGIYVSSDDPRICYMAELRGATPAPRPPEFATDTSPDIEWIDHFFRLYRCVDNDPDTKCKITPDAFAILRPTSPFRSAETIRRAWAEFQEKQPCDSIRAVEKAKQSPFKMWSIFDGFMNHLLPTKVLYPACGFTVPSHSCPTQVNYQYYAQNASLEISWTRNVTEKGSISGSVIKPFFTQGYEGFDINSEDDWILAEALIERGLAQLPEVK
jgi:CMP-N-acetylneuraminic acid synthetase